jgi:hypothetical protein
VNAVKANGCVQISCLNMSSRQQHLVCDIT